MNGYRNETDMQFSVSAVSERERLHSETVSGISRDRIMISTENPVRGLRVLAAGMDVSDYRKNPVVGYNHSMGNGIFGIGDSVIIPLARTVEIIPRPGVGTEAEFEWPRWGEIDEIDKFHKLWDMRFLHAASIWFRVDKIEETKNKDDEVIDRVALKSTLREWSIVYMPADPDAVREARSIFRNVIAPAQMRRDFQKTKRIRPSFDGFSYWQDRLRNSLGDDVAQERREAEGVQRQEKMIVPVEVDVSLLGCVTELEKSVTQLMESFQWQKQ